MGIETRMQRRRFLKAAGVAALTVGVGSPLLRSERAAAEESVSAFLSAYFAARARAASDGQLNGLDAFLDTGNGSLARFERERASFLQRGAPTRWDGTILGHASAIDSPQVSATAGGASVLVNEIASAAWIQNVRTPSPAQAAAHAKYPAKYVGPARGPRGEITSRWAIPHQIELTRHGGSWRVAADGYDEAMGFGRSPDLVAGSAAAIWFGKVAGGRNAKASAPKVPGLAAIKSDQQNVATYDPSAAVWYAHTYWNNYYPYYCNYNACGGDCANFVSQCFRQGGDTDLSPWYTYTGGCGNCGTSATYAGTDTWANNSYLHDFLLNSDRGYAWYDIASMGVGDMINYDIYGDWVMRHVVIVTAGAPGSNPLVTGHNQNVYDVPYSSFSGNMYLTWHW